MPSLDGLQRHRLGDFLQRDQQRLEVRIGQFFLGKFPAHSDIDSTRRDCKTTKRLAIAPFARRFGGSMHILQLAEKLRCQSCGKRGVSLQYVGWDEPDPVHFSAY